MKIKKTICVVSGAIALVAGIVFVLSYMGYIDIKLPMSTLTITPYGNRLGIGVSVSKVNPPVPLSTVSKGYTYKWKATITNTGTVAWTYGQINVRLGTNGATAVLTTCAQNPSSCQDVPNIGGSFYVERCSYGTDVTACREELSTWGFKFSQDGTNWLPCPGGTYPGGQSACSCSNKVCAINLGDVGTGTTKTIYFQLTVPSTAASPGSYPFIVQGMAYADAYYAVSGQYDTLTVGTISGNVTLAFIGFLSLLGGLALIAFGIKP